MGLENVGKSVRDQRFEGAIGSRFVVPAQEILFSLLVVFFIVTTAKARVHFKRKSFTTKDTKDTTGSVMLAIVVFFVSVVVNLSYQSVRRFSRAAHWSSV
jgi:hypothetical protein